ncbi:MAG: UDP-3-O-acyl-N-acetylglucosamine deacetylase [Alphaproteobacteria bacterium]|nr:UDP-3-O-acyl-N-acetylglucosamine deacetylase [Alphaproteobacteria bacterium]
MNHFDQQHTFAQAVTCTGVGLHSGAPVTMTLHPADADHGIVFKRSDIDDGKNLIPARYDCVVDTRLGTTLANENGTTIATIEHLMAALWGCGVDNGLIEIDGPEIPIMDGSSEPFVFQIETAGLRGQSQPRNAIRITRKITASSGDAEVELLPYDGFAIDISIDFEHKTIAHQAASYDFSRMTFKHMLSRARTFGFEHEVEMLQKMGLARGGSLHNAIVIGEEGVLNREGLRFTDEFVRHKALDAIGDLYLAGAPLLCRVKASRPGHSVNNLVLRALFDNPDAWTNEAIALNTLLPTELANQGSGLSMGANMSGALHE